MREKPVLFEGMSRWYNPNKHNLDGGVLKTDIGSVWKCVFFLNVSCKEFVPPRRTNIDHPIKTCAL